MNHGVGKGVSLSLRSPRPAGRFAEGATLAITSHGSYTTVEKKGLAW